MKKTIIIFTDGQRAFAQGNIVIKSNRTVKEQIQVEGSDTITDAEFEQFAMNPAKVGVATFVDKVKTEATLEKQKSSLLKKTDKAGIISEEVTGLPNKEKAATF